MSEHFHHNLQVPDFPGAKLSSFADFKSYQQAISAEYRDRIVHENSLLQPGDFTVPGRCVLCGKDVNFKVDYVAAHTIADGTKRPNWRERMICACGLNNRVRACVHFVLAECSLNKSSIVYISEQSTVLYRLLHGYSSFVIGSEYYEGERKPGHIGRNGYRFEDMTALSFPDNSLDHILTFDVLEHVPDYRAALREGYRTLKPGGHMVISVPFALNAEQTIVRAKISDNGEIAHLLPEEYHGDPMGGKGILCFYHFGWDLLDQLREFGFSEANAHLYWSAELGYLGGIQILLMARK